MVQLLFILEKKGANSLEIKKLDQGLINLQSGFN